MTHALLIGFVLGLMFAFPQIVVQPQWDQSLARAIGQALGDALRAHRIAIKEAAALMSMDKTTLEKWIRGEPGFYVSLYKIAQLPVAVSLDAWARYLYILGQIRIEQFSTENTSDACHMTRRSA